MPTTNQIREEITNKIIAALESGNVPWQRPWSVTKNSGRPSNAISKKAYTGINVLLTELHRVQYGLTSKWHGTYDQITALGGTVKKRPADVAPGEWACKVVFFKPLKVKKQKLTGEEELKQFALLRTYSIFNIDQCEGEKLDRFRVDPNPDAEDASPNFEPMEQLIEASGADIRYGGDRAFYTRPQPEGSFPNHTTGDYIQVPHRNKFLSLGCFYETLAHEMGHWSEVRTGFDFKTHGYAFTELVAEMAASYLSCDLGIPNGENMDNHAMYLKSWLEQMKGDSTYIFKAATWASKATDYLLSFVGESQPQEQIEAVAV
jgi:antirestriction protein ArdC